MTMIRINLIPGKGPGPQAVRNQQVLGLIILVLLSVGFFAYTQYTHRKDDLKNAQARQQQVDAQIKSLKAMIGSLPDIEAQQDQLLDRQGVLLALAVERLGPQIVLNDLKLALSRPQGRVLPIAEKLEWNVDWDPNNLAITSITQSDPDDLSLLTIKGHARSYTDVSEFWQRLNNIDALNSELANIAIEDYPQSFRQIEVPSIAERSLNIQGTKPLLVQEFTMTAHANFRYRTMIGEKLRRQYMEQNVDACEGINISKPDAKPPASGAGASPGTPSPSGSPPKKER